MFYLLLQTFLLMLAAFLLGAVLACIVRRLLFAAVGHKPAAVRNAEINSSAPVDVLTDPGHAPVDAAPRPASVEAARFERALAGDAHQQRPAAASAGPDTKMSPTPAAPAPYSGARGDYIPAAAAAAAAAGASRPHATPVPPPSPPPARTPAPAMVATPAEPPRIVMPVAGGTYGQAAVAAPTDVVQQPAVPAADDLQRIRGIDAGLARRLADLGLRKFEEIARWKAEDVRRFSADLGLKGDIARDNWIEQATILAKGGETYFSSRQRQGQLAVVAQKAAVANGRTAGGDAQPASAQRLTELPARTPGTYTSLPAGLPTQGPGSAVPTGASAVGNPALPDPRSAAPGRDQLQRIKGITPEVERFLNGQGITRFSQIAGWTAGEVQIVDQLLGRAGRIAAENWIEQAAILATGTVLAAGRPAELPPTRPARLADAIRENASKAGAENALAPRAALAGLRSVRSEALRGPQADADLPRTVDDLKRIRGIGVLIEKKLQSLGITSFEQVANWTGADIDRVSNILDFKGRIERENWVEQARILASGGQTEFSRRSEKSGG